MEVIHNRKLKGGTIHLLTFDQMEVVDNLSKNLKLVLKQKNYFLCFAQI